MFGSTPISTPHLDSGRLRLDRAELAGAVADLGVLVPIAVALIVTNGLSATAVLLPAGLLYVAAGLYYRLPVPVQPLKAFGATNILRGGLACVDMIAFPGQLERHGTLVNVSAKQSSGPEVFDWLLSEE